MEPRHKFLNQFLTICLDESKTLDQESIQIAYQSIFDNLYNSKECKKTGDKKYEANTPLTRDDLKQLIIATNKGYQAKTEKHSRVADENRKEQCITRQRVKT